MSLPTLTPGGKSTAILAVGALGLGASFASPALLASGLALGIAIALDITLTLGRWPTARVQVSHERAPEGASVTVEVTSTAPSARIRMRVESDSTLAVQGGGEIPARARLWQSDVMLAARGPRRIGPVVARWWSPARIWARERPISDAVTVLVIPRADDVDGVQLANRRVHAVQGRFLVNRPGQGFDFFALRQYDVGDTMRSVNWKASARLEDGLIVNQRQRDTFADLTIIVDGRWTSGAGPPGRTPLDRSCRMALALLLEGLRARDRVRLCVHGEDVKILGPGRVEPRDCEDMLAALESAGEVNLGQAWKELENESHPRGPVIVFTSLEDDDSAQSVCAELLARQLPVTIVSPRPLGPSWDDGQARQAARLRRLDACRAVGASVVDLGEAEVVRAPAIAPGAFP